MTTVDRPLTWRTGVAVAAFVGLLMLCGFALSALLDTRRELLAELDAKTRLLESLEQPASLEAPDNSKPRQTDVRAATIAAATETVAASELHKAILGCLEESGGAIHSIQAEATSDVIDDNIRRITAQVTFDGSIESLQQLLLKLETTRPYVFIDSLSVQPSPSARSGSRPWDTLRVSFVASSYWQNRDAGKP
jgi:hypothetical protein